RLPPDPERMASAPYWEYHGMHLEKRRADLLRRVAASVVRIDKARDASPSEAAAQLVSFQGVGPWTVSKTLAVSHGDADQVDVGDFHLKHVVVYHLTGRSRGTDEEMLDLLEPFRPHRGRVTRLLHILGPEPSFGPRVAARDITQS
ncbi:MAG: DNA-3-methyladenine glycosylase family protein, partial [Acidimicrobiia bacterium]